MTGQENLRRHSSLHKASASKEATLKCLHCVKTFSRPDLRLRHLRRKHPDLLDAQIRLRSTTGSHSSSALGERASTSPSRSSSVNHTSEIEPASRPLQATTTEPNELDLGNESLLLDLNDFWDSGLLQNHTIVHGTSLRVVDYLAYMRQSRRYSCWICLNARSSSSFSR